MITEFTPSWPVQDLTKEQKVKVQRWVKALESGRYKQGIDGYLWTADDEMCCLGVFCRIMRLRREDELFYGSDDDVSIRNPLHPITAHNGRLPVYIRAPNARKFYSLAGLNDNGATFSQIAKIIRRYYLGENVELPENFIEVAEKNDN